LYPPFLSPSLPFSFSSLFFLIHSFLYNNQSDGFMLGLDFYSASQAERIDMLNIALNEKGVVASGPGSHYEPTKTPATASASRQPHARPPDAVIDESNDAIDGGVML
jgi:hypothetical protein